MALAKWIAASGDENESTNDQNPTEYAYVQLLVLAFASLVETRLHKNKI